MEKNDKAVVVETTKEFHVPVEKLYEAWNNGDQLKKWWHPFNKNLTNVKNDLRQGGELQYDFDGEHKCHVTGEYQEVVENKRLVYSWNWDLEHDDMKNGDYTLTIDFVPEEGGSRLKIRQEGFTDENATEPHKQGWDRGLESLRTFLEDGTEHGRLKNESKAEGTGTQENEAAPTDNQRQPVAQDNKAAGQQSETSGNSRSNASENPASAGKEQKGTPAPASDNHAAITTPKAENPEAKGEGQPEATSEQPATGKGPKPVGPSKEIWENPEASEEVKKKIEDQKAKMEKLHNNPNAQDPALADLNKKQDIESRNESPAHDKKFENNTQQDFDPQKNKNEAPTH